MRRLSLNPHVFFELENGQILAWNYEENEQYLLNSEYFFALLQLSAGNQIENDEIREALTSAHLITEQIPNISAQWGWDDLSKIFHIGTQNIKISIPNAADTETFTESYLETSKELTADMPSFFLEREGPLIELPKPDLSRLDSVSFLSVIKNRRTCRDFLSQPISLVELSTILYSSFGLIHGDWEELKQHNLEISGVRKASPSGGSVHPEEAYVVIYRVQDIAPGLYHYRPYDHKLTLLKEGFFEDTVINMNADQFYSKGLSFGVYITARFERSWWKYKHSRAYRVVLLDIGHTSQTFLLSATALNLQTWLTGLFYDRRVHEFLGVDGLSESAILFVGIGKGTDKAIPSAFLQNA